MVRSSWRIYIGLILVGMSIALGLVHIAVFRNPKDLFFYLTLDIVFVPIQVLLVTLIIEKLLAEREKQTMLNKLNMVIGAFFGEAGNDLLKAMLVFSADFSSLSERFRISPQWAEQEYLAAKKFTAAGDFSFAPGPAQLKSLRNLLLAKREFLLALLENPNLLEHEAFTDLLWAVFHLTEELEARGDFETLPETDLQHLEKDISRAFSFLIREWLAYLRHLREAYPYIYSLELRTNPFNPEASPIVKS